MSAEYTYAAAFVKSLEINMITAGEFLAAVDYDSGQLEDFLRTKGYEGKNIGEMLDNEQIRLHGVCLELTGNDEVKDVLISENDFHNIKAVMKSVISKRSFEDLIYERTRVDCAALSESIKSGDFSGLDESISGICGAAFNIYKKEGMQAMEMFLDRMQISETVLKSNGFVRGWAELKALFLDLKIYLRASGVSKQFLEKALLENSLIDVFVLISSDKTKEEVLSTLGYKKEYDIFSKSPAEFEKHCDDELMSYLEKAKTSFFDFDAILGYFEGKKTEIKNIRLIAYAKKSGMQAKEVKERLRKTYV